MSVNLLRTVNAAKALVNNSLPNGHKIWIDYSVNGGLYKFCVTYFINSNYKLYFTELKNIRIIKDDERNQEIIEELAEKIKKNLPIWN